MPPSLAKCYLHLQAIKACQWGREGEIGKKKEEKGNKTGLQVGPSHEQLKPNSVTVHLGHDSKKGDHVRSKDRVEQSF
jgi:hypothetical protein